MPFISLYITSEIWPFKESLMQSLDSQLKNLQGFNTKLCKYRLTLVDERIIEEQESRNLISSDSIRCEFVTFNDRSQDVLMSILKACEFGIKNALISLKYPWQYSVTIIPIERSYNISGFNK
ncbi:hypothetical protein [Xenorhabdus anantnagensis]|uniref:Uncharacterized protein n=1 Tax=Xenorhabdus anantnagensis TaxID=3025875 RepID=A0ABT5LWL1_9GAMM|nr:hypothetical protein [Xenorhabdus anantnagensis]MDC9598797.1 hypothetical protein [Xenorhabdus anantnagensis]